jgi:flagellin-like protein
MTKKRKGISPLVAVIMLIAFTMIIAGILAGWATRFATEQRSMLEKCVRANIVIKRATYDSTTQEITLMLYNAGTVPLTDFTGLVSYKNETGEFPTTSNIRMTIAANTFETAKMDANWTDVDYVELRSFECQGAYDMIRSYDIRGSGLT